MKKRYRIVNKFRFTIFITVCLLLIIFLCGALLGFFNTEAASVQEFVSVRVQPGDTLWDLAKEYGPSNCDVRKVIYDICELNGVDAGSLQIGTYLTIPTSM